LFKFTIKTQQRCIHISILLWLHVSALIDHLQANIQEYDVQSVHIIDVLLSVHIMYMHWLYLISVNVGLKMV